MSDGVTYSETILKNGGGDELRFGNFGQELVVGGLIKKHHVVHLLLLLSLAPLLHMTIDGAEQIALDRPVGKKQHKQAKAQLHIQLWTTDNGPSSSACLLQT